MKLKCLQCDYEFEGTISYDELGWHSSCPKCGGSFDVDVTFDDKELESMWQELEDVPVYENEKFELCLDVDWKNWLKGTDIETIWHWFDEHHSKGVGWLMNEYEPDVLSGGYYE